MVELILHFPINSPVRTRCAMDRRPRCPICRPRRLNEHHLPAPRRAG